MCPLHASATAGDWDRRRGQNRLALGKKFGGPAQAGHERASRTPTSAASRMPGTGRHRRGHSGGARQEPVALRGGKSAMAMMRRPCCGQDSAEGVWPTRGRRASGVWLWQERLVHLRNASVGSGTVLKAWETTGGRRASVKRGPVKLSGLTLPGRCHQVSGLAAPCNDELHSVALLFHSPSQVRG